MSRLITIGVLTLVNIVEDFQTYYIWKSSQQSGTKRIIYGFQIQCTMYLNIPIIYMYVN